MDRREHWQQVYDTKRFTDVSWYAEHLEDSLRLIRGVASLEARIIDVGAGASTLVDDLVDSGYRNLTVLDLSAGALEVARQRLGARAEGVQWIAADVTRAGLAENAYDVWHDRAVFHFLTQEADRQAYVAQVRRSVMVGGHVIMGTFALDGPSKCSGLDVVRYDAVSLAAVLGQGFALEAHFETSHVTPAGHEQHFQFGSFRRQG